MDIIVAFFIGTASSLFAVYLVYIYKRMSNREKVDLDIEGAWLEEMIGNQNRRYSIGIIKYDKKKQRYTFDGANYCLDGTAFCTWRTPIFHIDVKNLEIAYIFKASLVGKMNEEHTGFGVIHLKTTSNSAYTLKDGYYHEATEHAQPLTHNMRRLDSRMFGEKELPDSPLAYSSYIAEISSRKRNGLSGVDA